MDVLIHDNQKNRLVSAEIVLAVINDLPVKVDGWSFNWKMAFVAKNSKIYALQVKGRTHSLEGLLQLSVIQGMLFMDLIELAPHNVGKETKQFEFVAGCLISFGCFQSFKLETNYKGFVSFETKTVLRKWYKNNYFAQDAMGNKMFIAPDDGIALINQYLNRKS